MNVAGEGERLRHSHKGTVAPVCRRLKWYGLMELNQVRCHRWFIDLCKPYQCIIKNKLLPAVLQKCSGYTCHQWRPYANLHMAGEKMSLKILTI
jgi:hypothetical protein